MGTRRPKKVLALWRQHSNSEAKVGSPGTAAASREDPEQPDAPSSDIADWGSPSRSDKKPEEASGGRGEETSEPSGFAVLLEQLGSKIAEIEEEIRGVEATLEDVQSSIEKNGTFRGKDGDELRLEEQRLSHKAEQLREEKKQLRQERLLLLNAPRLGHFLDSDGGVWRRV